MEPRVVSLAVGLFFALAGLPVTGCTLIGYAIGSGVDASNATGPGTPVPSRSEMEEGDLYRVVKIDSSVVIGTYVTILPPTQAKVQGPYDKVQESYDQWRDADSSRRNMPRCLDRLEITLDTPVPRHLHGRLDRISADSLWVVADSGPRPPIQGIWLHEVRTLTSTTGGQIEGQDLREKAAGMALQPPTRLPPKKTAPTRPASSTLVLRHDEWSEHMVPIDSIAYVYSMEKSIPSCRRWVYMGVGMIVDILVWLALWFSGVYIMG